MTEIIMRRRVFIPLEWPTADNEMKPVEGWCIQPLSLSCSDLRIVDALVPVSPGPFADRHAALAVHRMIDEDGFDDGWAVSTINGGRRLTYDARVFARCEDAVSMAEEMMTLWNGWARWVAGEIALPGSIRVQMGRMWEAAEIRGEILSTLVMVSGR